MDLDDVEHLRQHPAWRLLRADNAALVIAFLGRHFVDGNRGATAEAALITGLEDELEIAVTDHPDRYPKRAGDYLTDWAANGWLRRFYPLGSDEVHYDATPALERAVSWVTALQVRPFVGTASRLHIVVDLLRQIVHGSETDPQARLEQLRRRRDELDREIADAEAGHVDLLDATALRDRYQQFANTSRELLSDFRQVEENFRGLDRAARERIAAWQGSKGDLLADLVGSRSDIANSDEGRSFQAFYDFLLSESRQDELSRLLRDVRTLDAIPVDTRLHAIHHDWADAAERTQFTVRQISEQLRRFLDDQVWLENRRVLELVRAVESAALTLRQAPPQIGLEVDEVGLGIALPFERPLFDARPASRVDSLLDPETEDDVDLTALFSQTFVDQARLAANVREAVPVRSSALLSDLVDTYPVEQGAAEIVGYLGLSDDDIEIDVDEGEQTVIDYVLDAVGEPSDARRRARLAKVTVTRR